MAVPTWANGRRGDGRSSRRGYRVEFVDSMGTVLNVTLTEAALLELAGSSCVLAEEVDQRRGQALLQAATRAKRRSVERIRGSRVLDKTRSAREPPKGWAPWRTKAVPTKDREAASVNRCEPSLCVRVSPA